MINPYRTLNSHLPERSPPAPDALPSDPKRLRTWVEALPRANHQAYLQALSHALDDFRTRRLEGFARLDALEVLRHVSAGETNRAIAQELHLSEGAVVKHVGAIFDKLGLSQREGNRRVLAVLAFLDRR